MNPTNGWQDTVKAFQLPSSVSAPRVTLFAILAASFGFYARTLGFWFFFDDFWFLRASQSTPFGSYALNAFNYRHPGPVPEFLYRPLYIVSFRGLYEVFGLHAWVYHLFNVTLHLASGVLLWQIAVKITRRPLVGHLATLIFVLHPTYAVAVAFVANGIVVMSTFAALSSLWLFLLYLDGGDRRRLYYAGAFLTFVGALLLHPETAYVLALLVVIYVLLGRTSLDELRSVRAWLLFIPFFVLEIAFLVTLALAREANPVQSTFNLGPHMIYNYTRYAALALDPYRAQPDPFRRDLVPIADWRTLLPVASGVATGAALLFFERKRPRAGAFALLWFTLAVLPMTTWTAGAFARKLYGAGPGFALAVAIFAVSAWDLLPARLHAGLRYLAPIHALFLLVVISMGMRVLEMTAPFGQAAEGYWILVAEVRAKYPEIPEGSRLFLAGVPRPMLVLGGSDNAGVASAMQLYYGNIEVIAVADPAQLARLPNPPTAKDTVFQYHCPPVCQPPVD